MLALFTNDPPPKPAIRLVDKGGTSRDVECAFASYDPAPYMEFQKAGSARKHYRFLRKDRHLFIYVEIPEPTR